MKIDEDKAHYVVVTCIIVKNRKFLIVKRSASEKNFPNKWTVPGGKLEVKDYIHRKKDTSQHWYNVIENLIRREVEEEVGLKIKNLRYLTSLTFINSDGIPTLVISMFADYGGGKVRLSKELSDYAWVSLEEAKEYNLIEGIYEELEMVDKILKGEKVVEWSKT